MRYLFFTAFIVGLAAPNWAADTKGSPADEAAVRKTLERSGEAFNRKDVKTFRDLRTEDWNGRNARTGSLAQRPSLEQVEKTWHNTPNVKTNTTIDHVWFVTPDVAVADGSGETSGLRNEKGEAQPVVKSFFTWILRKENGDWKIAAVRVWAQPDK